MKYEVSVEDLTRYVGVKKFIVSNPKTIEEWKARAKYCGMLAKIEIKEIKENA